MATATKTPRLLAAAKEFNIGKDTLVEFLVNGGFEINASNPNAKLTEVMYDALQASFAQDKLAKRKSDEIALPKGSLFENAKKPKEEQPQPQPAAEKKQEEPVVQVAPPAPAVVVAKEEKPQEVEVPIAAAPKEMEAPAPAETIREEQPQKPAVKEDAPAPTPVQEPKPQPAEQPVTQAEQPAPAQQPAPAEVVATPVAATQEQPAASSEAEPAAYEPAQHDDNTQEAEPNIHLGINAPKLEGPNILGKINLEALNLSSRPKKVEKKPFERPAPQQQQHAPRPAATPQPQPQQPVAETRKENTPAQAPVAPTAPQPEAKPFVPRPQVTITPVAQQPPAPLAPAAAAQPEDDGKPEHIEMRAPRLEGPKIIGKINLPVSEPGGNRQDNSREKRNRKRIPVQKKPENGRPATGAGQQGGSHGPNQGQGGGHGTTTEGAAPRTGTPYNRNNDNRGPNNRPGGTGGPGQRTGSGPNDRRPGQSGPGGDRRPGGPNNRPGTDRRPPHNPNLPPQEIDEKEIQRKIQETQAKLAGGGSRNKNLKAKYRRNKREEMAERRAAEQESTGNTIQVTEFISVSELASLLDVNFTDIISKCMSLGIMVSINQRLDAEVIELVASEFGYDVEFINLQQESDNEEIDDVDDSGILESRAPIVTIMGHVDHGKTSLLDYIRSANVVAGEAGGITQHIGAYQVKSASGKKITFLDTPGHEAFTAMRARGAKVADVAVIVIAADDAIMPQTKEAISHAQAANLPMVFALNKIDKEGANPEKIKEQLANMNLLVESWGGKYQSQEISAKKGLHIDDLLEKIGLEAELLELKANPEKMSTGSVIEASLDKGRGYVSTILVQNGTLKQGDMVVCGQYFGKVKAMFNERGQRVTEAGPSTPVQILGLNGAPQAGEKFRVYEDENEAKNIATHRAQIMREQGIRTRKHITLDEIGRRLALGNFKELAVIIKGDFDGSVEALSDSLQKLSTQEVAVNVVHKGVGQITESDVLLATASDAIILGFQVRPSLQAAKLAEQENIEIRNYSIIYDAIDEIKSAMEGLLEPKLERKTVSNVEIREVFKISGIGTIAGSYVLDGKMSRNSKINLIRDGIVVFSGELASLKRFKDDVKEVNAGYECGLSIKNYNDIRVGDIIEGIEEVEVKRTLN